MGHNFVVLEIIDSVVCLSDRLVLWELPERPPHIIIIIISSRFCSNFASSD